MNLLIVDDQASTFRHAAYALREMGHQPYLAENATQVLDALGDERIDALLLDFELAGEKGFDLLAQLRARGEDLPVLAFTPRGSIDTANEALRRGAHACLPKPFLPEDLKPSLARLEERRRLKTRLRDLERQLAHARPPVLLESFEPVVRHAYDVAFRAAATDAPLLLVGPPGTGKSVLARAIHERSPRHHRPFVVFSCRGLPRERFETELFGDVRLAHAPDRPNPWGQIAKADEGTLLLDGIGECPLEAQPRLLRLLQDRTYERTGDTRTRRADVRLLATTHRDLAAEVASGRFREDLWQRLNLLAVDLPPLAARPADLRALIDLSLRHFARENDRARLQFAPDAFAALATHRWPGNLRELHNLVERAVLLAPGDRITLAELPEEFRQPEAQAPRPGQPVTLDQLEQEHIRRIVAQTDSLERAARILGIDTATLYRKRKRMGLL